MIILCFPLSPNRSGLNDNALRAKYPDYEIDRSIPIYRSPNDLNHFVDACFMELNLHEGNFNSLSDFLEDLLGRFEEYTAINFENDYSLSYYLRAFTAGEKLVQALSYGVDLLIERDDHWQAAAYLRLLISQCIYGMNEIGDWYLKMIRIQVGDCSVSFVSLDN